MAASSGSMPAQAADPIPPAAVRALADAIRTLGSNLGYHGGTCAAQLARLGAAPADAQALADWLKAPQ